MSELQSQHAAHQARLSRMGGSFSRPVVIEDESERVIRELNLRVAELTGVIGSQSNVIAEQRVYIEKLAGVACDANPKLEEIFSSCCKYYGISPADMRSPSKGMGLPFKRQIFYFLGRESGHSLHQIGRHIHKDHSCVVYGARKISDLLQTDEILRDDIDVLRVHITKRALDRRFALEGMLKASA